MGGEDAPTYYFNAYPGTELFDQLLKEKKIKLGDDYFHSLATLSHYNLSPTNTSYNEYMGRFELYFYRMIGMMLAYSISYLFRPKRILRTIKSFFSDSSKSVAEQRLKDLLRRSPFFQKNILTKIHGGGARDRKRKLLDKQKKRKARAKQFGRVEIPQEAFIGVLKINKET